MTKEKIGRFTVKQVGSASDRVLRFIGTDETEDRDGDIIKADGWDFTNYKNNPVFLPFHDYEKVPIGKCISINRAMGSTGISFDIKFPTIAELCSDPDHPSHEAQLADTVYMAYTNGFMNAVSVGFIGKESSKRDDQSELPDWLRGNVFTSQELLELSAVSVPSNPQALLQARSAKSMKPDQLKILEKMFKDNEINSKSAIPFKHYPLAEEGQSWDAGKVIKESTVEELKVICTWYDAENEDVKGSYKLPHHMGSGDDYKTVWKGVSAAMAALLGARGGVNIPESDREKCHSHLAKHYKEFDKEVPEFKFYSDAELKSMFKEADEMTADEVQKAINDAVEPLQKQLALTKAGSKHSADTLQKMYEAVGHMEKGMGVIKDMIAESVSDSGTAENVGNGRELPGSNVGDGNDEEGKGISVIDMDLINLKEYV
jgi:hypothetical protein